ncbi:DUF6403 family protein [Nakamurella lactea]|uniref:DUF6403 family protein n=1 Tax=Nakamurella lactea TaxID=459515 RepID=UPI0004043E9C|nr:DUF6403 family protein [Nakamurella lactea]
MDEWPIWLIGVLVLVIAGVGSVVVVRNRSRRAGRDEAVAGARAALEAAEVSRDACHGTVPEADQLFDRAHLIISGSTGASGARQAAELADRADRLWQAANG